MFIEKLIFFDVIIEDDEGETEPQEEVVPYQLSKEAIVLDMKVQDIRVMTEVSTEPLVSPFFTFLVCTRAHTLTFTHTHTHTHTHTERESKRERASE